jgi:tetrahydromethanopterin S-methyltransferase subunit B
LLSTRKASVSQLTTDEFWGLLQIGIVFVAFLAVILVFVYLAYEKPSA